MEAYDVLAMKVREYEADPAVTMTQMVRKLVKDDDIDWKSIEAVEKKKGNWDRNNWQYKLIRSFTSEGRFRQGGDHCSASYRDARQQALVAYVEGKARAAPPTVPEEEVTRECLEDVQRRWRPRSGAEGDVTVLRRVVRRIVHTVRVNGRVVVDDELNAMEIEEIAVNQPPPTGAVSDALALVPEADRVKVLVAREAIGVIERLVTTTADDAKWRLLTDRLFDMACPAPPALPPARKRAKSEPATPSGPRSSTTLDQRLRAMADEPFRGRVSLSHALFGAVESDDIVAVFRTLQDRYVTNAATQQHLSASDVVPRLDKKLEGVVVLYAPLLQVGALVEWLLRATASDAAEPTDPTSTTAPEATEERPRKTPPARHPAPPGTHRPQAQRAVFPPGVADLVEAVLPPGADEADRAATLAALRNHFLPATNSEWAVLWPRMTPAVTKTALWTTIDVTADPIVADLAEWLRAGAPADRVPPYPSPRADPRPAPTPLPIAGVEGALPAGTEVLSLLVDAGLGGACSPVFAHYNESAGRRVWAAGTLAPERVRQFHRVTNCGATAELSFAEIAAALGWLQPQAVTTGDTNLVKGIVAALMAHQRGIDDEARWYNSALWRWSECLPQMRIAAVFVARLRLGGADLGLFLNKLSKTAWTPKARPMGAV